MTAHVVSVIPAPVGWGGKRKRYQAVCSCGWEGLYALSRGLAEVEGVTHATGHEPVRRPKPPRRPRAAPR